MIKERFLVYMTPPPEKSPSKCPAGKTCPAEAPKKAPPPPPPEKAKVEVNGRHERQRNTVLQEEKPQRKGLAEALTVNVNPYLTIPGINAEKIDTAKKFIKEALAFIKTKFNGKKVSPNISIDYNDTDMYLPLMIKESKLDNSLTSRMGATGYFQLMKSALDDVNLKYAELLEKDFVKTKTNDIKDPLTNCVYGILYYHLSQDHYAKKEPYAKLTPEEQKLIGYMSYNKGPSYPRELWKASGKKNFADFEKFLAGELAKQLGVKSGDPKKTFDANYNVDYPEFPGVKKYLELLGNDKEGKLDKFFTINGKETRVKRGQVGEMLRYARVIESIAKMKTVESGEAVPNLRRKETLKPKEYELWSMSEKLRKELCTDGKILKDVCAESEDDFASRSNFRDILIQIILVHNKIYNPAFAKIDIDKIIKNWDEDKPGPFKKKIEIFIPDDAFIVKNYELLSREDIAQEEEIRKQEETPEVKEVKSKLPLYADSKLDEAGRKPLKYTGNAPAMEIKEPLYKPKKGKRKSTKYVVLHSTGGKDGAKTMRDRGAHFLVTQDGVIHYLSDKDYIIDHCGKMTNRKKKAMWNGDTDLSQSSIGIEVAAEMGKEWNKKQYTAINKLVHWLSATYKISASGILTHSQVAVGESGKTRGRKGDPYGLDWGKLGLPDNHKLIDADVVTGTLDSNAERILDEMKDPKYNSPWYGQKLKAIAGLRRSAEMAKDPKYKAIMKAAKERENKAWKTKIEQTHKIIRGYEVKKGDTLLKIANRYGTTVETIKRYNDLPSDKLSIGQKFDVPQPK